MMSVIIPAHNEERVIARCISSLLAGAKAGEIEIIVVPNGCTDRTAEVARSFGEPVRVIESPVPSKSEALNRGDQAARGFPRFFVDADIVVSLDSLREVAGALEATGALAGAPAMHVDCSHSSAGVRAFYDVWTRLPYVSTNMIGSGVYGLSAEGRKRFDRFPQITADDGFIRLLFRPSERISVKNCTFTLKAPRDLRSLIRIKTRAHFGTYEMRRTHPELTQNEGKTPGSGLRTLMAQPRLWAKIPVYVLVMGCAKIRALWRLKRGKARWDRDESSRR